jgi:hypothetical protein
MVIGEGGLRGTMRLALNEPAAFSESARELLTSRLPLTTSSSACPVASNPPGDLVHAGFELL